MRWIFLQLDVNRLFHFSIQVLKRTPSSDRYTARNDTLEMETNDVRSIKQRQTFEIKLWQLDFDR